MLEIVHQIGGSFIGLKCEHVKETVNTQNEKQFKKFGEGFKFIKKGI